MDGLGLVCLLWGKVFDCCFRVELSAYYFGVFFIRFWFVGCGIDILFIIGGSCCGFSLWGWFDCIVRYADCLCIALFVVFYVLVGLICCTLLGCCGMYLGVWGFIAITCEFGFGEITLVWG